MVIVALDHVEQCYSAQDGEVIFNVLARAFAQDHEVTLSFKGVSDVPSSFVNAALVPILQDRGEQWVREHLRITAATKQVADMIKRCFAVARPASVA